MREKKGKFNKVLKDQWQKKGSLLDRRQRKKEDETRRDLNSLRTSPNASD